MKLHPHNPTPEKETKNLIHYTKNEPIGRPAYYTCVAGSTVIGTLEQEVDGYYYFFLRPGITGFWPSWTLSDLSHKLDALNEAWHLKLSEALKPK